MARRKNIDKEVTDDEDEKTGQNILIYKHNDECYIERSASCFNLTVHDKTTFYPTIEGAFKSLSRMLLVDRFKGIPNEEKNDIRTIVKAIEEHERTIEGMFKGY